MLRMPTSDVLVNVPFENSLFVSFLTFTSLWMGQSQLKCFWTTIVNIHLLKTVRTFLDMINYSMPKKNILFWHIKVIIFLTNSQFLLAWDLHKYLVKPNKNLMTHRKTKNCKVKQKSWICHMVHVGLNKAQSLEHNLKLISRGL